MIFSLTGTDARLAGMTLRADSRNILVFLKTQLEFQALSNITPASEDRGIFEFLERLALRNSTMPPAPTNCRLLSSVAGGGRYLDRADGYAPSNVFLDR